MTALYGVLIGAFLTGVLFLVWCCLCVGKRADERDRPDEHAEWTGV